MTWSEQHCPVIYTFHLQEKRSFTCDQLPSTWGSVPTSAAKLGKWASLPKGEQTQLLS